MEKETGIRCFYCRKIKQISEFYPSSIKRKDYRCIVCKKISRKENTKNLRFLMSIYYRRQVHNKRGEPVPYTFEEFYTWGRNNKELVALFRIWSETGYRDDIKPAIIRVDSRKGFTFDNLKVLEKHRVNEERVDPRARPVNQYTMDGEYVATFPNAKIASEILNFKHYTGISSACRGERNSSQGFVWRYA